MSETIQSVTRSLAILNVLAQYPHGLTVKEIAEKVRLNVSTTHHLVNTLEADDYIYRLPTGVCRIGLSIVNLYGAFLLTFQPDAHLLEVLDNLARSTRETTYVSTWQNGDIVVQAIHESPQALRIGGLFVGFRGAAHARAGGKALLAYLSEPELDEFFRTYPPRPITANTLFKPDDIRAHLRLVARQEYAIDHEEFAEGACCVAAPVFGSDGKAVAALSVSAPTQRFIENETELIRSVLEAAHKASAGLGHRSSTATAIKATVLPVGAKSS